MLWKREWCSKSSRVGLALDVEGAGVLDHGVARRSCPRPVHRAVVWQRAVVQRTSVAGGVDRGRGGGGDRGRAGVGLDAAGPAGSCRSRSGCRCRPGLPPDGTRSAVVEGSVVSVRESEPPEIASVPWLVTVSTEPASAETTTVVLAGMHTWSRRAPRSCSNRRLVPRAGGAPPSQVMLHTGCAVDTDGAPRATSAAANPTKVAVMPTLLSACQESHVSPQKAKRAARKAGTLFLSLTLIGQRPRTRNVAICGLSA